MQTTGFILLLAAGVIVFFGGETNSAQTLPSAIAPAQANVLTH